MVTIAGGILLALAALFALGIALAVLVSVLDSVGRFFEDEDVQQKLGVAFLVVLAGAAAVGLWLWMRYDWASCLVTVLALVGVGVALEVNARRRGWNNRTWPRRRKP